ncbi:MAG TPA: hypothetical protein VNV38_19580 [Stellaceae bacterium]|jgi:hypothetical protein|nr:hypothetical protein [Stellaceae bacterium]
MSHDLTRWIEAAEERRFSEAVAFERSVVPSERHFMHLGDAIAHLPSWLRHGVSGESLAAIGCQAVAFVRRLEHRHH